MKNALQHTAHCDADISVNFKLISGLLTNILRQCGDQISTTTTAV